MSTKPRLTFRGMGPGECPVVVIEIPLADESAALIEYLEKTLGKFFGKALTTRGA